MKETDKRLDKQRKKITKNYIHPMTTISYLGLLPV